MTLKTKPRAAVRRPHPALWSLLAGALLGATLLGGCQRPSAMTSPVSSPIAIATTQLALEARRPADPRLAEQYERACMTCHLDAASGAPRTHDSAAWHARAGGEREALITSVQEGRNAMPPMGLCPDCSRDDLGALIDFMRGARL